MDQEYLRNIMGSPYVNEGAFTQLKVKSAQAMSIFEGLESTDPTLRYLWEGFMRYLKYAMKHWESKISPMLNGVAPGKQKQVKDQLDALAKILFPAIPPTIGTPPSSAPPSPLPLDSDYTIEEGFWDTIKQGMGMNKTFGSNDSLTILNNWKNYIVSVFQGFVKKASRKTKMAEPQIYAALARIHLENPTWQIARNMQQIVNHFKTIQGIGDIREPVTTAPASVPPTSAGTPPAPPTSAPPTSAAPTSAAPASAAPASAGTPSGGGAEPSSEEPSITHGGVFKILPKDYSFIILHAIKVINNAVMSDKSHTGHYFDKDPTTNAYIPLPTEFEGPSPIKESRIKLKWLLREITSPPKSNAPVHTPPPDDNVEPEIPGEFLYNFHSKFRKLPATSWNIDVKPIDPNLKKDVEGLPGVKIKVIWNCHKGENKIYVVAYKDGKSSDSLMIMRFGDDDVNSKAGATTQGDDQFFTTNKIVQDSDPYNDSKLEGASPEILQQIKVEEEKLLRSLMATTHRKIMEFKSKKGLAVFPLKWYDDGSVTYKQNPGDGTPTNELNGIWIEPPISRVEVGKKLQGKDYKKWEDSLNHTGYFEQFPNIKPKDISAYPAYAEAEKTMKQEHHDLTLLMSAWMKLRQDGIAPEHITADQLLAEALKPKVYYDAIKGLVNSSHMNKEEATAKVDNAEMLYAAIGKKLTDISLEDLLKAAYKGKIPTDTTKEPGGPGGPEGPEGLPPTPPVKPPGGGSPTSIPSGIVKMDDTGETAGNKFTVTDVSPEKIEIKIDKKIISMPRTNWDAGIKNGSITLDNPTDKPPEDLSVSSAPKSPSGPTAPVKIPDDLSADDIVPHSIDGFITYPMDGGKYYYYTPIKTMKLPSGIKVEEGGLYSLKRLKEQGVQAIPTNKSADELADNTVPHSIEGFKTTPMDGGKYYYYEPIKTTVLANGTKVKHGNLYDLNWLIKNGVPVQAISTNKSPDKSPDKSSAVPSTNPGSKSPASDPASGSEPSQTPSISNPDKKKKKKVTPELSIDKNDGTLMYMNKDGYKHYISKKTAMYYAKKYSAFADLVNNSGIDLNTLKESRYSLNEKLINPFQRDNFLLS